jgi:hypothetical protein
MAPKHEIDHENQGELFHLAPEIGTTALSDTVVNPDGPVNIHPVGAESPLIAEVPEEESNEKLSLRFEIAVLEAERSMLTMFARQNKAHGNIERHVGKRDDLAQRDLLTKPKRAEFDKLIASSRQSAVELHAAAKQYKAKSLGIATEREVIKHEEPEADQSPIARINIVAKDPEKQDLLDNAFREDADKYTGSRESNRRRIARKKEIEAEISEKRKQFSQS